MTTESTPFAGRSTRHADTCGDRMREIEALVNRLMGAAVDSGCTRTRCLVIHGVIRDSLWKIEKAMAGGSLRPDLVCDHFIDSARQGRHEPPPASCPACPVEDRRL